MTGFIEPWIIAAAGKLLAPIAEDIVKDNTPKLFGFGKDLNEAAKQKLFEASKQYIKNYAERHGILKVLGMREPVELESVYTGVKFLGESDIDKFASIEKLELNYREANNRRFQSECQTLDGIKVADDRQFLMVLGQPGSGKSTFLRRMGLEALKGKKEISRHKCIPVFLELKTFKDDKVDIEKQIVEEFKTCGFPKPEEFTKKALERGTLLILLDGLDEVPKANTNAVITQIQDFVDRYDRNRFIASCRTPANRSSFKRFFDVTMADFDDEQINKFIDNWFQSELDKQAGTSQKCRELLQRDENKAARELARTPLLLTFLCLGYDRTQGFPSNRSRLYGNALRILLEEWAAEKRIEGWSVYEGLSVELEELLLAQIAYENFTKDKLFFDKRDLVAQIKTFLASNLNAPKHLDGEAVLNAIAIQQGILVERAEDVFSFSHLTLQEYLAAQYIVDRNLTEQFATEHLVEQRWREVFLLVAGLMRGGADNLLTAMETSAQQLLTNSPKPLRLLQWSERITTGSGGNLKPATKRITVLFLVLSRARYLALALDLDLDFALDHALHFAIYFARALDFALDLNLDLEKLKIFNNVNFSELFSRLEPMRSEVPDDEQSWEIRRAFADRLLQTWCQATHLDPDLLKLSENESKLLSDYLYANYMMVQCKDAAVRVSPQVWQKIEDLMLIPPD